jgi:hypothetical protein
LQQAKVQAELGSKRHDAANAIIRVKQATATIADMKEALRVAEEELTKAEAARDRITEEGKAIAERVAAWPDLTPKVTALKESLATAGAVNAQIQDAKRTADDKANARESLDAANKEASELDGKLIRLRDARSKAIMDAKFPVKELSVSEDGDVLLDGLPFDNASTSRKIQVGIALAASANPQMRVAFVRDGSLLDGNSMTTLRDTALKFGLQVWVEVIKSDDEGAIQIVEGTNSAGPKPLVPVEAAK